MNKKLFAFTSLPFALNILLPIFSLLTGTYPYPSLFINQADTYNDFYAICYWTFNKVGTYGEAFKNIYPPFAHLPCLLFSAFFPNLENGYDAARLLFPNFLPLFILYTATAASFFLAYRRLKLVFRLQDGWFIPWCMIASSPFIFLLDRGNLLMVNVISLNLILCLLCAGSIRNRLMYIVILAAVPVASKPYLALNYIAFPLFSILAICTALALNFLGILIWQPYAVHLIVSNIRNFTDTSGLFVSIPSLIVDGQAFTSFRQYANTLFQAVDNSDLYSTFLYEPLRFVIVVCLGFYYVYCAASIGYLGLIVVQFRLKTWFKSISRDHRVTGQEDQRGLDIALTLMIVACSTYALVIGILPVLTKSVYWYGVCHLLPCVLIADTVLYASKTVFRPVFILFYQSIKVITLTTLIFPPMSRLCELEPFHRRFVMANFSFLYDFFNREYSCPTPGFETIAQFSLRMINLPLLCLITAYILLKYLQAVRSGAISPPLLTNETHERMLTRNA